VPNAPLRKSVSTADSSQTLDEAWAQSNSLFLEHCHPLPPQALPSMLTALVPACPRPCRWLGEYKCDGLRFDSANDLPHPLIQRLTWRIKQTYPGRFLTAEVTPENPQVRCPCCWQRCPLPVLCSCSQGVV
jgi:hypothetical protein